MSRGIPALFKKMRSLQGVVWAVVWCALMLPLDCLLQPQPPLVPPEGPALLHGMEEIHRPLNVVNRLYREALINSKGSPVTGDFGVREHFLNKLHGKWHEVPSLNTIDRLDQLEPGCLVRFRCMVQAHFNPEFYIGQLFTSDNQACTTKFRDSLPPCVDTIPDVSDMKVARAMWERLPIKCVEIPGETAWSKDDYAVLSPKMDVHTETTSSPRKRHGRNSDTNDAKDGKMSEEEVNVKSPPRRFVKGVRSAAIESQPDTQDHNSTAGMSERGEGPTTGKESGGGDEKEEKDGEWEESSSDVLENGVGLVCICACALVLSRVCVCVCGLEIYVQFQRFFISFRDS